MISQTKRSRFGTAVRRLAAWVHGLNESSRFRTAVKFAENLGKFAIVITAVNWLIEIPDRKHQRDAAAWQLINAATGKSHDGGRSGQLAVLVGDGVSLEGLDLSAGHFRGLKLRGANLQGAHFSGTQLSEADFSCRWVLSVYGQRLCTRLFGGQFGGASISDSTFAGADLTRADFGGGASLEGVSFADAKLIMTTFSLQRFDQASFARATLIQTEVTRPRGLTPGAQGEGKPLLSTGIDMHDASIVHANFSNLTFFDCDFRNVDLNGGSLTKVKFVGCNFSRARIARVKLTDVTFEDYNNFQQTRFIEVDLSPTLLSKQELIDHHAILCGVLFQGSSDPFYDKSCRR